MKAEILTVGTEILLGDILNTNTWFLSRELAELGVGIYRHTSVGDNEERLAKAFERALRSCEIVITTGGLGPTGDDITKEVAAKVLGKELVMHEESLKEIKCFFHNNNRAMHGGNEKQAMFPADAIVLDNPNGTAPGAIMGDGKGRYIIVLPGPPKEMEPMFKNKVRPFIEKLSGQTIKSEILRFTGIGEWELALNVKDLTEKANPSVAPYAKDGECILRVTAMGSSERECHEIIKPVADEIIRRMPDKFYAFGEQTLEEIVPLLLLKYKLTISTAESITGGLLASTIINCEEGISKSYTEGYVTYSNEAKERDLGVSEFTLAKYGAVSEEVALQMATGCQAKSGTDIAISTTGIAGPSSDGTDKPVGLTYVGIYYKGRTYVYKNEFLGRRNMLRRRVVRFALEKLLRLMEEDYGKYVG